MPTSLPAVWIRKTRKNYIACCSTCAANLD
ncbi:MAG: TRASH domain-containing protein [Prevotellaceae bacterium]|nr:TRASH domain-containing protein [Prevotellaceae bacterium]